MNQEKLMPVYPGEVLLEEFLKPMNLSQNQIALALRVPARRINEIVHGKRRITADTALRFRANASKFCKPYVAGVSKFSYKTK
jgi:addiction module HigA family antidote